MRQRPLREAGAHGDGEAPAKTQAGEDGGPVPSAVESLPPALCLEPASCCLWPVTWQEAAGAWVRGILLQGCCPCSLSTWDLLGGPVGRVGSGLCAPGGLGSTELPLASQPHPEALRVLEVHLPQAGQDHPPAAPPHPHLPCSLSLWAWEGIKARP